MDARCWHIGADLSKGAVTGDQIICPFHGWRYGASGDCEFIPSQDEIPASARQRTYHTEEDAGYVFVFPCNTATMCHHFSQVPNGLISFPLRRLNL